MSKHNVVEMSGRDRSRDKLTQLIGDGRKPISGALEVEVSKLLSALVPPYVRKTASFLPAIINHGD